MKTDTLDLHRCLICNRPVPDYEPEMCCSGSDCGCMGMPTEPCVCSRECWDALSNDGFYEDRREKAGIPLYVELETQTELL